MKRFTPYKPCLRIFRLVTAALGTLIFACISYVAASYRVTAVTLAVTAFIVLLTAFVYAPLYFSSISYTVSESGITAKRGVFIKREQSIRFASVQYTTTLSLPLSKKISIDSVIFYVYGGKLRVSFLSKEDSAELLGILRKEK